MGEAFRSPEYNGWSPPLPASGLTSRFRQDSRFWREIASDRGRLLLFGETGRPYTKEAISLLRLRRQAMARGLTAFVVCFGLMSASVWAEDKPAAAKKPAV